MLRFEALLILLKVMIEEPDTAMFSMHTEPGLPDCLRRDDQRARAALIRFQPTIKFHQIGWVLIKFCWYCGLPGQLVTVLIIMVIVIIVALLLYRF